MNSAYLLDFKNITNLARLEECLSDWEIKKISDRIFQISGRDFVNKDMEHLYHAIGVNGHIFVYDYQNQSERFYQRHPKGRKRWIARDADLDAQTVSLIEQYLANLPD